jgi:glycosyltransferase involved in cell wall biosynthesis
VKILAVHNRYQSLGGEDEVYRRECGMLAEHGHELIEYTRDNREIAHYGIGGKITLPLRTIWAWDSYRQLATILAQAKPDVAHFHNTFPLVSPAAYYACSAAGVPVVQTIYNPRLLCPAATLFRDGGICEDCVGRRFAWPAVRHACYQNSGLRSGVVASMISAHHGLGTWNRKINTYLVATEFYRRKFAAAGFSLDKIAVKPHFLDTDPGCSQQKGNYAVFVGRLAPEKGVPTLLAAWEKLTTVPLYIRGDGPLAEAASLAQSRPGSRITLLPRMDRAALYDLIRAASFLVWPSEGYYETFGLIAIEAFACGVPVIASRVGVMEEIVHDGRTGLHFTPGDASDLARKVEWAGAHPDEMREMGRNARAEYEAKYTAERNYRLLLEVYRQAIQAARMPLPSQDLPSKDLPTNDLPTKDREALRVAD